VSQGPIILPYKGIYPKIDETAFIAPGAVVVGDVEIGPYTNIWFGVVIRADVNKVRIGARTNIQDGTICHVTYNAADLMIGDEVTIGHNAILHGCHVHNGGFVGMGATVMDNAVVESGAMVAAGALISPKKVVKTGELWAGTPAKIMRSMTQAEVDYLPWSAEHYVRLGQTYKTDIK